MMEWWAILLIVLACVIVGGFLLLFAVKIAGDSLQIAEVSLNRRAIYARPG